MDNANQLHEAPCGLHLFDRRVLRCPVCARVRVVNLAEASKAGATTTKRTTPGKFQPSQPDDDVSGIRRAIRR